MESRRLTNRNARGIAASNGARAALLFSGFLRQTCGSGGTLDRMLEQARWCRSAFGGRCDVFLHTWSTLQKSAGYFEHGADHSHWNLSLGRRMQLTRPTGVTRASEACVRTLRDRLAPTAVAIDTQPPPTAAELARERPWGASGENLLNMRRQIAGMRAGFNLMRELGRTYDAAVRMRADLGDNRLGAKHRGKFLTEAGWKVVSRRAALHARGQLGALRSSELVTCDRPRTHAMDFCLWSAPPAPLLRTAEALAGASFDAIVHGGGGESCAAYLNRTSTPWLNGSSDAHGAAGVPLYSENILFCAMRAVGVRPSPLADGNPNHAHADARPASGAYGPCRFV